VAWENLNFGEPSVGERREEEAERRLETIEEHRQRRMTGFGNLAEWSIGEGRGGADEWLGERPPIAGDKQSQEAYYRAWEQGLLPDMPSPAELRAEGALPEERPTWIREAAKYLTDEPEGVGQEIIQGVGRLGAFGLSATAMAPLAGAGKTFLALASPPTSRTVRDPTVLSLTLDALETAQRVTVVAPIEIAKGMRPTESWYETMGKAFIPPSVARGKEPRDAVSLYRRLVRDEGGDPDSMKNMMAGLAFAIFTDPLTFLRGPSGTSKMNQLFRIVRGSYRHTGFNRHAADKAAGAFVRRAYDRVSKMDNPVEMRQVVKGMIDGELAPSAGKAFGALGDDWGRAGVSLAIPFTAVSKEIIPFSALRQAAQSAKAGATRIDARVGAYLTSKQRQQPFSALDLVNKTLSFFDPAVERGFVGWDGAREYYDMARLLEEKPTHGLRVAMSQIGAMARKYTSGVFKGAPDPFLLPSGELVPKYKGQTHSWAAERQWAQAYLNMPAKQARERATSGLLTTSVTEMTDELVELFRRAYAKTVIKARDLGEETQDSGERFHSYITKALRRQGFAEDSADAIADDVAGKIVSRQAAEEVGANISRGHGNSAIEEDIYNYASLHDAFDVRMSQLVDYHSASVKRMLDGERAVYKGHAVRAARTAAAKKRAEIRAAGRLEGETAEEFAKRLRVDSAEAARSRHNEIMGEAVEEIDNYVFHFLRDQTNIRSKNAGSTSPRGGAAGQSAKRRVMLDIVENYEHGQNPSDDLLISLAARQYAHMRVMHKHEVVELALSNKKWARRGKEGSGAVKGLVEKEGWTTFSHPITGEAYSVRKEVVGDLARLFDLTEPGMLEKTVRMWGRAHAPWKAAATHGRPLYYNLRNMVDDTWRMSMGGYSFAKSSFDLAMHVAMLGRIGTGGTWADAMRVGGFERLEVLGQVGGKMGGAIPKELPMRQVLRNARQPATTGVGKRARRTKDALDNWYDKKLIDMAQQTRTNKWGQKATLWELYSEAARRGVVEKGFVGADLARDVPTGFGSARRWDETKMTWEQHNPVAAVGGAAAMVGKGALGTGGVYLRATGSFARWNENTRRLAMFVDRWKAGHTFDEADALVRRWLFDYKDLTEPERKYARSAMPFYTFLKNSVPATIRGMVKNPGRYTALAKGKRVIEERAEFEGGPIGVVADYMDDLFAVRIPPSVLKLLGDENGSSPVFWNVGLSMTDLNVLGMAVPGLHMGEDELWDRFTPAVDIFNLLRGFFGTKEARDPRTQRKITGELMEPDAFLMGAAKTYDTFAPGEGSLVKRVTLEGGHTYDALPAELVHLYRKMLPNLVAYGRIIASKRGDPFEEEQMYLRRLKELTGQSLLVNNPVRAELNEMGLLRDVGFGKARGVRGKYTDVQSRPRGWLGAD
jgi:hypothetical protein